MKVFSIDGYWADGTPESDPIQGSLISEFDEVPEGYTDDQIFFHGLSESDIQCAIESKDPVDNEFYITSYEEIKECIN